MPISRRDQNAVKQLLPLFDREITADPEQHNPARRAARREDIAQAKIYFKEQRAAHEQRKDDELRAKLDSTRFENPLQHAYRVTKTGAATPRLGFPANAGTIMMQPHGPRNTIIKVRSKRGPLTTILNPNPTNTTTVPQIQTNPLTLSINSADDIAKSNTMSVSEDKSRGPQLGQEANMERSPKIADPHLVRKHQTAPKRDTLSPTSSRTMSAGTSAVEVATPPGFSGDQKSDLSVRAGMAQVTLTDDVGRSEPRSDEAIQPEPGVHTTTSKISSLQPSDVQSRGHAPKQGLLDCKDHDVKRICGKVLANGKVRYVVRWKSDWINAELLHEEKDSGRLFVKGVRAKWYIKKRIGHRERGGIQEVKVRWVNTQEPPKYLKNAREAIRLFEAKQPTLRTNDGEYVRQRKILTIAESRFPLASVLPQSEEDYAASQRWVASSWPSIRPHETLDLYPAIYRIHMELINLSRTPIPTGKSYRNLMKLPQLRPLRWKSDYVASGRRFNGGKRRRASIFIQVTGVVTATQCTRCQGERITPFLGCVRTGPDDQLWLNGACANCGTQDNGDCNYHGSHQEQPGQSKRKSSPGYPKTSHSAMSGKTLHATNEGIDDSDDDSEGDDSDDSDNDDAEADGGHNRVANSTLWPSSPPIPRNDERSTQHIEATSSSTNGPSWSSSTALNSSSSDTMASSPPSVRRGKLPSVTKAKRLLAQKASGQSGLRARPLSSSNGVQKLSLPRHRDVTTGLNITNLDVSMSAIGASSSPTSRRRHSRDEFDPEPIEQDMLELSAKYDDSGPVKHRTLADRGVTNPQAAGDTVRRKNPSEQRTDGGLPQIMSRDRSNTSSASFGPPSKKRAAPEPLLPERPSRPSFTSAATSVSILPDRSVTAAVPNLAAVQSIDTAPAATPKSFLRIENTAEINRDAVHLGCRLGQPCRDHEGAPPVPRNSRITVYRNTLSADRPASLEEAEFILSRANCFWARRFTVLWESWCQEKGGTEREERSQVAWLVSSFPELLVRAARECCPNEVIIID